MPRVRLAVALLLTGDTAREVDGLRRACGDGAFGRVSPHLTLVPPVNVRIESLPVALGVLRGAASATEPFTLELGPPTTFWPVTPTLHLEVGGTERAMAALLALRDAVFVAPFERQLTYAFVPHVTLADGMEPARIEAARAALRDYAVQMPVERVHLLQEVRDDAGERRWQPIADASMSTPIVVGRGGVELDLAVSQLVDPEAAAFEQAASLGAETSPSGLRPSGATPIVVVARRRGEVVGLARGWTNDVETSLTWVVVDPSQRRQGIARQLIAAFEHAAQEAE